MNASGLIFVMGFLTLYALVVVTIWVLRVNRKQERPPTPEILLRAPGESLRRKLEHFDDTLLLHLMGSAILPAFVMALGLIFIQRLEKQNQIWVLVVLLLLIGAGMFFSAQWLVRILTRRRNHYLGYFGERVVGERLGELAAEGYLVFHDTPALEAKPTFNLDHIVVGPTGVFAIETKTRRKGDSRPGLAEHKIISNGQSLLFPWGEDSHGLRETQERARWLQDYLYQIVGYDVPVTPILTFPGWWVEDRGHGFVRVTNPKQIAAIVRGNNGRLTPQAIEVIAKHLDQRCRDVGF